MLKLQIINSLKYNNQIYKIKYLLNNKIIIR